MSIRGRQDLSGSHDAKNDAKNTTERQSKILHLISQNPNITLDAIAEAIGVSSPTIDREIAKMTNLVKRVDPKKGGHWGDNRIVKRLERYSFIPKLQVPFLNNGIKRTWYFLFVTFEKNRELFPQYRRLCLPLRIKFI